MSSFLRHNIRDHIVGALCFAPFSVSCSSTFKNILPSIIKRFRDTPVYGKASEEDFGLYANTLAALCAYNDKQYYLYKAVEDKNKIGYLSRKQYRRLQFIPDDQKKSWCSEHGRMVTLYKLLSRAKDENQYARFLKVFEERVQNEDERKDFLECFSVCLHNIHGRAKVEECTIKEAYDLPLRYLDSVRGGGGSGNRYAVTSCMERYPCEEYYKAFGVKACKVIIDDVAVGRFLVWKTKKGKTYVDRLYCNAADAQDALSAMEAKFGFDNVVYYPNFVDEDDCIVCPDATKIKTTTYRPYVDSFYVVKYDSKDKNLFLQQAGGNLEAERVYRSRHSPVFEICNCGEFLFKGDKDFHSFICPESTEKIRNKDKYMAIYKLFKERQNEPLY